MLTSPREQGGVLVQMSTNDVKDGDAPSILLCVGVMQRS